MSAKASVIAEFSPPGNIDELTVENKSLWSRDCISKWMDDEIAGNVSDERTPLSQFFNGTLTAYDIDQAGVDIAWVGFPNRVYRYGFVHSILLTLYSSLSSMAKMMRSGGLQQTQAETSRMSIWNGLSSVITTRTSSV